MTTKVRAIAFIMMLLLSAACRRQVVSLPTSTLVVPTLAVTTPTAETPAPTPSLVPTTTPTIVPSATPQPLTKDLIVTGSVLTITIQGQQPIVISPQEYGDDSAKRFANWKDGIALVNPRDVYGNMVADVHSGYDPDGCRKLPAEDLRVFIQGKVGCGALSVNDTQTEDQLIASLLGLPVTIVQDNKESSWYLGSAQRIDHVDIKTFRSDTYQLVNTIIGFADRDGYNSTFLIGQKTHGLMIIISLRAPEGSSTQGENLWSYEALVIGLYPDLH